VKEKAREREREQMTALELEDSSCSLDMASELVTNSNTNKLLILNENSLKPLSLSSSTTTTTTTTSSTHTNNNSNHLSLVVARTASTDQDISQLSPSSSLSIQSVTHIGICDGTPPHSPLQFPKLFATSNSYSNVSTATIHHSHQKSSLFSANTNTNTSTTTNKSIDDENSMSSNTNMSHSKSFLSDLMIIDNSQSIMQNVSSHHNRVNNSTNMSSSSSSNEAADRSKDTKTVLTNNSIPIESASLLSVSCAVSNASDNCSSKQFDDDDDGDDDMDDLDLELDAQPPHNSPSAHSSFTSLAPTSNEQLMSSQVDTKKRERKMSQLGQLKFNHLLLKENLMKSYERLRLIESTYFKNHVEQQLKHILKLSRNEDGVEARKQDASAQVQYDAETFKLLADQSSIETLRGELRYELAKQEEDLVNKRVGHKNQTDQTADYSTASESEDECVDNKNEFEELNIKNKNGEYVTTTTNSTTSSDSTSFWSTKRLQIGSEWQRVQHKLKQLKSTSRKCDEKLSQLKNVSHDQAISSTHTVKVDAQDILVNSFHLSLEHLNRNVFKAMCYCCTTSTSTKASKQQRRFTLNTSEENKKQSSTCMFCHLIRL